MLKPLQCTTTLCQLKQLHGRVLKLPIAEYWTAIASLLTFAAKSANPCFFSYAQAIFQNLGCRTTFLYNTMIQCCVQGNRPIQGILRYKDMVKEGLIKNNFTFTPVVKACCMILPEYRYMGLAVHSHLVKLGFYQDMFIASALIQFYALVLDMKTAEELFAEIQARDVVLWTCMIDGYGKLEEVEKAKALFNEMPQRNVVSWSVIMAAYSRVCDYKEVLFLYRKMECSGIFPNESSLVTALTACAHLGALAQGLWIHSYAEKLKYTSNPILATALVDMYSKCGCTKMALTVFYQLINRDSGAWNAIISGLAMNGESHKSLELFDKMISSDAQPTEATLTAVLTACTHAKLTHRGLHLFQTMRSIYNIEPNLEHYACMVDLLARSGQVEEAEQFVDEITGSSEKYDVNIWGALLGACRIYGNIEIGNRVWRKIENRAVYECDYGIQVLAYNMYRVAGWENEAMSVRRLMLKNKKTPGCSAIEVDGVVVEFIAGILLHSQADELCRVVDSLLCYSSIASSWENDYVHL